MLVVAFYSVVYEIVVIKGFFKILINTVEVGIEDFCDVVQLTTNAAG